MTALMRVSGSFFHIGGLKAVVLSILRIRVATVRGGCAPAAATFAATGRPRDSTVNGSQAAGKFFSIGFFPRGAVRSEPVWNCFEGRPASGCFHRRAHRPVFRQSVLHQPLFRKQTLERRHLQNLSRSDADDPIGGLDQIVTLASAMLASKRISEGEAVVKFFGFD